MKLPVALAVLASPFSLSHDERWVLRIALGFFTLLTVYFTWQLKAEEGDKWIFRRKMKVSALFYLACEAAWQFCSECAEIYVSMVTCILFLYVLSQALVYGIYCVLRKKKTTAAM